MFEGWKQIASALEYSERQTFRFYRLVKNELNLRHYLGPGHRMRMDNEDIAQFKNLIIRYAELVPPRRGPSPRIMAENGMICQTRLFD